MEYIKVKKNGTETEITAVEILTDTGILYVVPVSKTEVKAMSHSEFWSQYDAEAE